MIFFGPDLVHAWWLI